MNSVDRADQLRHYYRPDGLWFRMRKWWWSVFLWALGQAKVNAYVAYMAVCKGAGKKPMTHLKFHVAIVTAWCTTPEVVLKYECKGGPKAAAAPAADQGVRGVRDAARIAEAAAAEATKAAEAAEAAEATGSPGAAAAATPGPRQAGDKTPQPSARRSRPSLTRPSTHPGRTLAHRRCSTGSTKQRSRRTRLTPGRTRSTSCRKARRKSGARSAALGAA